MAHTPERMMTDYDDEMDGSVFPPPVTEFAAQQRDSSHQEEEEEEGEQPNPVVPPEGTRLVLPSLPKGGPGRPSKIQVELEGQNREMRAMLLKFGVEPPTCQVPSRASSVGRTTNSAQRQMTLARSPGGAVVLGGSPAAARPVSRTTSQRGRAFTDRLRAKTGGTTGLDARSLPAVGSWRTLRAQNDKTSVQVYATTAAFRRVQPANPMKSEFLEIFCFGEDDSENEDPWKILIFQWKTKMNVADLPLTLPDMSLAECTTPIYLSCGQVSAYKSNAGIAEIRIIHSNTAQMLFGDAAIAAARPEETRAGSGKRPRCEAEEDVENEADDLFDQ